MARKLQRLDETNFMLFCAKHYENPGSFDDLEFQEDVKRVRYVKRLLNKYLETGDLKERLILNHLIVLCNVFGPEAAVRILFFKLKEYRSQLKPFLELIGVMPAVVRNLGLASEDVKSEDVVGDSRVKTILETL